MKPKKIYIAASFHGAARIFEEAEVLADLGHIITGVWFQSFDPLEKMWDGNFGGRIAEVMALRDFSGIDRAKIVIIDTLEESSSGGRNVELGYALAKDKRIILIGEPTTIFFSLIRESYETWDQFHAESDIGATRIESTGGQTDGD